MQPISGQELQRWLAASERDVCLVFADITDSVAMTYQHGTKVFGQIRGAFRRRGYESTVDLDGAVVEFKGDEILSLFVTVSKAHRYALALAGDAGHPLVAPRIGIHFGSVSYQDAGLSGRAVAFAHRVMEQAATREIWMSDIAKKTLELESPSPPPDIPWIAQQIVVLKGVPTPQLLWRAA
jgi:class 3 adenylate cyclase